ncbi:Transcription factor 7-like 1 [Dissostichus eleginoides]|uniref:Transcription factor 7-like 1 n=1 Tax=Dissostichus eleginoides TaxID=100907 RepID=A0AAD9BQG6_DISEL|nr:Transcription factor 7-like 1 [Dissostichus eleginoides]
MMDRSAELEWILSEMSPAEMLSTLMETRGGIGNGQELYQVLPAEVPPPYFPPPVPAAPSLSYNSKKRRHNEQQDSNRPYVRKPLNAFMLYMKEQRALLKAEVDSKDGGQRP